MTLITKLIERFKDSFEYRHTYVESFTDSAIATQIKVLREQQGLTQTQLAERANMGQSQISTLEDVNNSTWKVSTLKKLARAFDLVLVVRFEEFGKVLPDIDRFGRSTLQRKAFMDDPVFSDAPAQSVQATDVRPTEVWTGAASAKILAFGIPSQQSGFNVRVRSTTDTYSPQQAAAR